MQEQKLSIINSTTAAISVLKTFMKTEGIQVEVKQDIEESVTMLEKYMDEVIKSDTLPEDADYVKKIMDNFSKAFTK